MRSSKNVYTIYVDAEQVVQWGPIIRLHRESLLLLESVAGVTPDEKYLADIQDADPNVESWGWYVEWNRPDAGYIAGRRTIGFWFRNRIHAIYFKLIWNGQ